MAKTKRKSPGARAMWKGTLQLGNTELPVKLYGAVQDRTVRFRLLHARDKTPVEQRMADPGSGKEVDPATIQRGLEIEKGVFVILKPEELEPFQPEPSRAIEVTRFVPRDKLDLSWYSRPYFLGPDGSEDNYFALAQALQAAERRGIVRWTMRKKRDIELTRFVNRTEIDPSYFERSYYLVPAGGQTKAYRLLAETMERSGRAGIASLVMRGTGYAVAIFADNGVLRAETLRFGDEVRTPKEIGLPAVAKAKAAALKQFKAAIDKLDEKAIDESELEDDEIERILDFAEKKRQQGKDIVEAAGGAPEDPAESQVIDLMQELQRRLKERPAAPGSSQRSRPARARSTRGRARRAASKSAHGSG